VRHRLVPAGDRGRLLHDGQAAGPGFHTIVVHGTNTLGDDRTYNYRLIVTG